MADWIVEPYLKNRNIVTKPMHHSVARRAWFAATCKQTPAILNFLECLKMYFAGADMNVDESEKKSIIKAHAAQMQKNIPESIVPNISTEILAPTLQAFNNYQY